MRNSFMTIAAMLLLVACNFEEDLRNSPTPNKEEVNTSRSTFSECEDLQYNLSTPPITSEIAELFECLLNVGINQSHVQANCDDIDSYQIANFCANPEDIADLDISSYVGNITQEVVNNTEDCDPCLNPDPTIGCRTIIYDVEYVDDECQGSPSGHWAFNITARVFCC